MASGCFILLLLLVPFLLASQVHLLRQPSPVSRFPPALTSVDPCLPTQQAVFGEPDPLMCFARGDLPSPFRNGLQHCLDFLIQSKRERRETGLFGAESFEGVALKFALIVPMGWALLISPVFGFLPSLHSLSAGGLPSAFPKGWSSGVSVSDDALPMWVQHPHGSLYSCSIVLQQGTNI